MQSHRFIIYSLCLLILTCTTQIKAQTEKSLGGATCSFIITDLTNNKTVARENADICMVPASITKLITTATALETLGKNFTFKTQLAYDGKINNGVLEGNIYIVGGGDPTLGSTFLNNPFPGKMLDDIKRLGIKKIKGSIVADANIFDNEPIAPGWLREDIGNYYAAGVYGIAVYDNTIAVTLQSKAAGTKPEIFSISPQIKDLTIDNRLTAWGSSDNSLFFGMPYVNYRSLTGTIPPKQTKFITKCDIPNPPLVAAETLTDKLAAEGIEVTGKPTTICNNNSKRVVIATYNSPKLSDIIKQTNYRSLNHYAEHIFKYLSLTTNSIATRTEAIKAIKNYWSSRGLNVSQWFLQDGSGLSANAALPAYAFDDLLRQMYKSPNRDCFYESLPIAGVNGTVSRLFKGTPLEGKAHLKSGSMARVHAYAGYIDLNNKHYSVVIIVNNFGCQRSDVRKFIEHKIIDALSIEQQ